MIKIQKYHLWNNLDVWLNFLVSGHVWVCVFFVFLFFWIVCFYFLLFCFVLSKPKIGESIPQTIIQVYIFFELQDLDEKIVNESDLYLSLAVSIINLIYNLIKLKSEANYHCMGLAPYALSVLQLGKYHYYYFVVYFLYYPPLPPVVALLVSVAGVQQMILKLHQQRQNNKNQCFWFKVRVVDFIDWSRFRLCLLFVFLFFYLMLLRL